MTSLRLLSTHMLQNCVRWSERILMRYIKGTRCLREVLFSQSNSLLQVPKLSQVKRRPLFHYDRQTRIKHRALDATPRRRLFQRQRSNRDMLLRDGATRLRKSTLSIQPYLFVFLIPNTNSLFSTAHRRPRPGRQLHL